MYDCFEKLKKDYKDIKNIIYTYGGTLFTYQFSHCWIDFRNKMDQNGIDWFENSIKATKANKKFCIDNENKFKTFNDSSLEENGEIVYDAGYEPNYYWPVLTKRIFW